MGRIMKLEEMSELLERVPPSDPDMTETIYTDYISKGFIIYDGKKNRAACTRCGYEWDLYPGEYARMHGLKEICPCCESENILLSAGRGRKCYTEYHRVLSFAQSGNTLWAFLNCIVAVFEDIGRPKLYRSLDEIYVINRYEQTRWHLREGWYGSYYETINNMKVPSAPTAPGWYESRWQDHVYTDGLMDMAAASDCRYALGAGLLLLNRGMSLPRYFGAMMRYHSVELLAKAGFNNIAQWKIDGGGCRAINWNADSLEKILKLPMGDIRKLRKEDPTCREIEAYQKLSPEERCEIELFIIRDSFSWTTWDSDGKTRNIYRQAVEEYMPWDKWVRWAKTQDHYKKPRCPHLLRDYKDYINVCTKLGMDIRRKSVLRPKDLKQAHDDMVSLLKIEQVAAIERAIAKNNRTDTFTFKGLTIIPATCQEDLNKESAYLGHCVKTYGDKIAREDCFIFFVRHDTQPDVPYYTLETKPSGDFVQCRGKSNCSMTADVKLFTDAFVKKLKAEINKERNSICQTA